MIYNKCVQAISGKRDGDKQSGGLKALVSVNCAKKKPRKKRGYSRVEKALSSGRVSEEPRQLYQDSVLSFRLQE